MSQPTGGGYGHHDAMYAQQQQQQQMYAYQQQQNQQQHQQQAPYPPLPNPATPTVSRSTLRTIVIFSTFINAVGGLLMVVGSVIPIRRYTLGPFNVEYYFYEGRINGESYPLGDSLQTPYAIAMALAIICGALALLVAVPIGVYDIKALSHDQEGQPHQQRRGCVRFARTIVLLIAIKMGAMASLLAMYMTSIDFDDGEEVDTFNTSNLSEGFALLVIGTILLGFADVLCVCHVIMAARVPQNDGSDQQHLIQQQHPQHHYPQQQQHAGTPTVYQGVPIGGGSQYPSPASTPINAAHPGNIHPNASYT